MAATLLTRIPADLGRSLAGRDRPPSPPARRPCGWRWWGTAWLRGHVVADHLIDAVVDRRRDAPGGRAGRRRRAADHRRSAGCGPPARPRSAPRCRRRATRSGSAARRRSTPRPSRPGEARGRSTRRASACTGWCRTGWARRSPGRSLAAERRQLPDVGEADRALRSALLEAADALAALDVARWRPEVADRLMNLRHRPPVAAPPGVPPRCVELAARGLQALAIVELALEDDGGALTAAEADARRRRCCPLGRAGRRALVAACSPRGVAGTRSDRHRHGSAGRTRRRARCRSGSPK